MPEKPVLIPFVRTPIKEIIFSISFKENLTESDLTAYIEKDHIKESFTISDRYKTIIQAKGEEKPSTNVTHDGYLITNHSKDHTVQVKRGSFALHRTKGYENFDVLFSNLHEYWTRFQEHVGTLTPTKIYVRYLNFFDNNGDNDDLLTIATKHPFDKTTLPFVKFALEFENDSNIKANIVTTEAQIDKKNGLVLDLLVNRNLPEDGTSLHDAFFELRKIKNDIFFKCITEKAKHLYSHE